jgi:hypothetical protein
MPLLNVYLLGYSESKSLSLICIYLWPYSPLLGLGRFFSFLIFHTIDGTPRTGDQPVARPLPAHGAAQTQNKHTQTSMPQVGFELTIPAFQLAKTVRALDCAATVNGSFSLTQLKLMTGGRQ